MRIPRKRLSLASAGGMTIVFSLLSLALVPQARILCEIGKSHSHSGDETPHAHASPLSDHHENTESGVRSPSEERVTHQHSGHSHATGAAPIARKKSHHDEHHSSNDEACCDSVSELQWGRAPDTAQVTPSALLYFAAYNLLPRNPILVLGSKQQLRLSLQNAPPLFSLSHIPTTVLLI